MTKFLALSIGASFFCVAAPNHATSALLEQLRRPTIPVAVVWTGFTAAHSGGCRRNGYYGGALAGPRRRAVVWRRVVTVQVCGSPARSARLPSLQRVPMLECLLTFWIICSQSDAPRPVRCGKWRSGVCASGRCAYETPVRGKKQTSSNF